MRSIFISILSYACESWALAAKREKRAQVFEMRCYRRLLNSCTTVINEEVRRKSQAAIVKYVELLATVKNEILGGLVMSQGLLP